MDQRNKIAVALGVMFTGVAAALAFRHESPRPRLMPLGALERVVLQSPGDDSPALGDPAARPLSPIAPLPGELAQPAPFPPPVMEPPDMARSFTAKPNGPLVATAPWAGGALGAGAAQRPLRHKIVDGDTLAKLAARYLGSADRAMEIYQNNRELLSSPDLLPIGVEIGIPRAR